LTLPLFEAHENQRAPDPLLDYLLSLCVNHHHTVLLTVHQFVVPALEADYSPVREAERLHYNMLLVCHTVVAKVAYSRVDLNAFHFGHYWSTPVRFAGPRPSF